MLRRIVLRTIKSKFCSPSCYRALPIWTQWIACAIYLWQWYWRHANSALWEAYASRPGTRCNLPVTLSFCRIHHFTPRCCMSNYSVKFLMFECSNTLCILIVLHATNVWPVWGCVIGPTKYSTYFWQASDCQKALKAP